MPNAKSKSPDDPEQTARFVETAKNLDVDESGKGFERVVKLLKPTKQYEEKAKRKIKIIKQKVSFGVDVLLDTLTELGNMEQSQFDFELPFEDAALWTPRDIWVKLNQRILEYLREDRRFERKNSPSPNLDDLAKYYSTFSNTPDGGLLVYGIADNGEIQGCGFTTSQINNVERCHITHCPAAKPEFKRVPVIVSGAPAFCLAIFVPYIGRLVETNKDEAWIRYGDSKHRMSDEEKRDFRATRQELSFELTEAYSYEYPRDFDLRVIQDFCDKYREREQKLDWSNEEVLIDRHLLRAIVESGVWAGEAG